MRLVLAALCVVAVAARLAPLAESEYQSQFLTFVNQYNKVYASADMFAKYNTFKYWVDYVRNHNVGNHTWEAGINEFSDLMPEEFQAIYLMKGFQAPLIEAAPVDASFAPLDDLDWRTKGAVNKVKNQGSCGSCWAFSTTGSLEGAWQIAKGALLDLSEQQLVDCSGPAGNQGCNGGLMSNSFKWIGTNKGITNQAQYGYTARQGSCKTNVTSVATVSGFKALKADENDLATAIALGPVSIALAASSQAFQSYKSGVLETGCGTQLNHGVLLVGFNTDAKLGDYWIVKNSWGQTWGNNGYIWIRAFKNVCGLANTLNCYPTV